jgi:hypothetical protein
VNILNYSFEGIRAGLKPGGKKLQAQYAALMHKGRLVKPKQIKHEKIRNKTNGSD